MCVYFSLILLVTIFNSQVTCTDINWSTDHLVRKEQVYEFAERIRNQNGAGDVEIPFPVDIVDPFEFGSVEVNLPGDMFSFNLSVSDGSISGVSGFRLLDLELSNNEPKFRFNVLFPELKFHSEHYELDGKVYYVVPIKGDGVAHMEIYNLQLWGTLYLKYLDTSYSILLDKLENADFHIERIVLRTEFDHNIDGIINAMVEDLLADYLNRFSKYITTTYSDTLIEYINEILLMFDRN